MNCLNGLRILALLLFTCSRCLISLAQPEYYNSEDFWRKLHREQTLQVRPSDIDTAIILVSSRACTKDSLRFMGEDCGEGGVSYFFIYRNNNTWHVLPVNGLKTALTYIPHKDRDWVVYTEGMGKLFTSDVERGFALARGYNVNVIMFDYPSITTTLGRIGNYRFAIHHAREAYTDFLPVLDTVRQIKEQHDLGSGRLTLFFHSMGNNVIREIVVHHQLDELNKGVWVDNLVLNAPCVWQKRHSRWLRQIKFADNIYVHYNPADHTLAGAHFLSFRKQLGEKVCRPLCDNVHYINFHLVTGKQHSVFLKLQEHPSSFPEAVAHYSVLFHGRSPALSDISLYKPSYYYGIGVDLQPRSL